MIWDEFHKKAESRVFGNLIFRFIDVEFEFNRSFNASDDSLDYMLRDAAEAYHITFNEKYYYQLKMYEMIKKIRIDSDFKKKFEALK